MIYNLKYELEAKNTMLKKLFIKLIKIIISAAIALTALTAFCFFYSNPPIHYATPDGPTDYKWASDRFRSQATEGFSFGKTNNEGYFNTENHYAGETIDILIMGSSQMEAANVMPTESTAALLGKKLNDKTVYNIGTSGHYLPTCAANLESALTTYEPRSFVIVQTDNLLFSDDELIQALECTVPEIPSYNTGIIGILQHNCFLRHLYHQGKNYTDKTPVDTEPVQQQTADYGAVTNRGLLSQLLSNMASKVSAHGAKLLIIYNPWTGISADGSLVVKGNPSEVDQYREICAENGILFLDMTGRFISEYEQNFTLPYGFSNTAVGTGHLNRYGHAMIADELFKLISEVE